MKRTETTNKLTPKARQSLADKKKLANSQIIEHFLVSHHHDSLQIALIERTNL